MPINPLLFILGRQFALKNRVSVGQANTDGLLAGVLPPVAGLVMAALLSENQEPAAPAPALPTINGFSPASLGPAGMAITISGSNFGAVGGNVQVTFNTPQASNVAQNVVLVDSQTITAIVPGPAPAVPTDNNVVVTIGNVTSQPAKFTVFPPSAGVAGLAPAVVLPPPAPAPAAGPA
jgi:IPT/TIG domain